MRFRANELAGSIPFPTAHAHVDPSSDQNDILLHRLIHTKLLANPSDTEDLPAAKRRKILEGRVSELAGSSKVGSGEEKMRTIEQNRAAKFVRDGLKRKKTAAQAGRLEELKQLGNYHPLLAKEHSVSADAKRGAKRQRGLKLGVGRFSQGTLRLTKEDISSVQRVKAGSSSHLSKQKRKK